MKGISELKFSNKFNMVKILHSIQMIFTCHPHAALTGHAVERGDWGLATVVGDGRVGRGKGRQLWPCERATGWAHEPATIKDAIIYLFFSKK